MKPLLLDPESGRRLQTFGEEVANSVSHGVGLLLALGFAPWLLSHAARSGGTTAVAGAAIFTATVALLYTASTLYHAWPRGPIKRRLRVLEHIVIYILIAGTYTPFTLGVLKGPWGWSLFGIIWFLSLTGLLLKVFAGVGYPKTAMTLYLLMGWVVVVAIRPMWLRMDHAGLWWILAGGLAYSGGVLFYAFDHKMRYSHFVWHLFVMAGTMCHFVAIFNYAN